jgi:hypothetical protein
MKPTNTASTAYGAVSLDLSGLGEHFIHCQQYGSRLFTIRCWTEGAKSFIGSRLITSTFVLCLFIVLSNMAI